MSPIVWTESAEANELLDTDPLAQAHRPVAGRAHP